jgi:hypothetical protein
MKWISVSEHLPEIGSRFLVYDTYFSRIEYENHIEPYADGGEVSIGRMTRSWGIATEGENGINETITHWMTLPAPPETGDIT